MWLRREYRRRISKGWDFGKQTHLGASGGKWDGKKRQKTTFYYVGGEKKRTIFCFTLMKHCAHNNHSYLVNELSETKRDVRCC